MRLDGLGGGGADARGALRPGRGVVGPLRGGRGGGRGARRERVPLLRLVEPSRAAPRGVRRIGPRALREARRAPRGARPRAGRHAPPLHAPPLVPRGDALDLGEVRRGLRPLRVARRARSRPGSPLLDRPQRAVRPRPRGLPRRAGPARPLVGPRRRARPRPPLRRARGRGGPDPRGRPRRRDRRRAQRDGLRAREARQPLRPAPRARRTPLLQPDPPRRVRRGTMERLPPSVHAPRGATRPASRPPSTSSA